jgi:hypothetical protein
MTKATAIFTSGDPQFTSYLNCSPSPVREQKARHLNEARNKLSDCDQSLRDAIGKEFGTETKGFTEI